MYSISYDAQHLEVPTPLLSQLIVDITDTHAIWIENARGYRSGVLLDVIVLLRGDDDRTVTFGRVRDHDEDEGVDIALTVSPWLCAVRRSEGPDSPLRDCVLCG